MNPTQREGCTSHLLQQVQTLSYQLTSALSLRLRNDSLLHSSGIIPAPIYAFDNMGQASSRNRRSPSNLALD